jgi:germination protein M
MCGDGAIGRAVADSPVVARLIPILLAALALAGCGSTTTKTVTVVAPTTPTTTAGGGTSMTAVAYFYRDGRLAPVAVRVPPAKAVAAAALGALWAGPPAGYTTALTPSLPLPSLAIDHGTATVTWLRGEHLAHEVAGQIVYTLTRFPSVQRVALAPGIPQTGVDGEPLDRPATRDDYLDVTPVILIDSPPANAGWDPASHVTGTAAVFEATLVLELHQDGNVLAKQTVTASTGAPERGTFDASFSAGLAKAGPASIVAYAPSAENGAPQHRVETSVTVTP